MSEVIHATCADGAVLSAVRAGTGPPVLLISGLGGTGAFWSPLVEAQAFGQVTTVRFDQRGIGGSARGTAPVDIACLAEDALAVMDAAQSPRSLIVGHSTGGAIAMALAARASERVAGLVLSGAWLRPNRYMAALFAGRRALLQADPDAYAGTSLMLAYPPAWLEANWHLFEAALASAPRSAEAQAVVAERIDALLAFDGSADASRLSVPTCVIGAKDDMIVPSFLQRALANALCNARLEMLPEGGHFFPHTQRRAFSNVVAPFIAQQTRVGGDV